MLNPADPELLQERMRSRRLRFPDRTDASIGLQPAAHWNPAWRAARNAEFEMSARQLQFENARWGRSGPVRF